MINISNMIVPFIVGLLLSILFFGGLWFTVKKLLTSEMTAMLMISSFIFRIGIVLVGFYFIGLDDWKNLIACLFGFMVGRFFVIHYTKLIDDNKILLDKEVNHGT